MGSEISPNSDILYFVVSVFKDEPIPAAMDLWVAHKENNKFVVDENSNEIMATINTDDLEYAPAISANGLELFFSRISGTTFEGIFVAKRNSITKPFGTPKKINVITGIVEAPTIPKDGKTLYYHKLDSGKFRIYKVTREEKQ